MASAMASTWGGKKKRERLLKSGYRVDSVCFSDERERGGARGESEAGEGGRGVVHLGWLRVRERGEPHS